MKTNGPNFNIRKENAEQVLYAIRNGGFSGAIMPENIVVGKEAEEVAEFLAAYSGKQAQKVPPHEHHARPTQIGSTAGRRLAACSTSSAYQASDARRRPRGRRCARRGERRAPRGLDQVIELDAAGARCCPSSRACAPSRTRPTTRIRGAADDEAREREIEAMRGVAARAKELDARAGARSRSELQAALAPLPNLPDPTAAPGPGGRARPRGRRACPSSASSRATTSSWRAR